MWSYDELVELRQSERLREQIGETVWASRHAQCQAAIGTLADRLSEARPDVAVLIGNDQMEVFRDGFIPALCVLNGASLVSQPNEEGPHEAGFVFRQLMHEAAIPSVPVLLNTFYPPNQPSLKRCFEFGRVIACAVASWDSRARVALIASGDLSHFVVDYVPCYRSEAGTGNAMGFARWSA